MIFIKVFIVILVISSCLFVFQGTWGPSIHSIKGKKKWRKDHERD